MIEARARYQYQAPTDAMELLAFVRNKFTGKDYQVILTLKERQLNDPADINTVQPYDIIDPPKLYQSIFDALWKGGMRPTGFQDIENETKAIKNHLNDMRRLVFANQHPYNIDELS